MLTFCEPFLTSIFSPCTALVAAQAHSPKQDRAVVISARNFIRALGGSAGLAIASAIFSNTIVNEMPAGIPDSVTSHIKAAIFEVPDMTGLTDEQRIIVLELYVTAAMSVFYLWCGAMVVCLGLMVFIKDKGLARNEEVKKESPLQSSSGDDIEADGRTGVVPGIKGVKSETV